MISYGQKTLNRGDVRKGTMRFISSFMALLGVTFLSVYLFFKSSEQQNKGMRKELDRYHAVVGKNETLKIKMDDIYQKLALLNTDRYGNQIDLRNGIFKDLDDSKNFIGEDSLMDLKQYTILINQIEPIIAFKDEMMKNSAKEKALTWQLNDCMEAMGKADAQIRVKQQPKPLKGNLFKKK